MGYQSLHRGESVNIIKLEVPYTSGDGSNFSEFNLFAQIITGKILPHDLLTFKYQSLYVRNVGIMNHGDFLEEYVQISVQLMTTSPYETFILDTKDTLAKVRYRQQTEDERAIS